MLSFLVFGFEGDVPINLGHLNTELPVDGCLLRIKGMFLWEEVYHWELVLDILR